jgi:hypothetical protein
MARNKLQITSDFDPKDIEENRAWQDAYEKAVAERDARLREWEFANRQSELGAQNAQRVMSQGGLLGGSMPYMPERFTEAEMQTIRDMQVDRGIEPVPGEINNQMLMPPRPSLQRPEVSMPDLSVREPKISTPNVEPVIASRPNQNFSQGIGLLGNQGIGNLANFVTTLGEKIAVNRGLQDNQKSQSYDPSKQMPQDSYSQMVADAGRNQNAGVSVSSDFDTTDIEQNRRDQQIYQDQILKGRPNTAPYAEVSYDESQAKDAQQLRNVITDVAGDKSVGKAITNEIPSFPLGQDYIDQFESGKALTDLDNAKKFTKKVQETEAKSPGFVRRMLSNPNLFPYLAIAFNTMRLDPDNALTGAMMKTIETNNELRKANRTAAWFRSQGTPEGEKAAKYIEAGGTGKEAMDLFMPKYSLNTRVVADPKTNKRKLITVSDQGIVKEIALPEGFEPEGATRTIDLGTKYAIQDSATGAITAIIDKDVAGEAEQKEMGKFTGEQKAQAPQNFVTAQNQFNVIMDLLNHPNFEDVFGFIQGRIFTLSPGATDAEEYLKQIQGAAFLQAFETLKGGGQITEVEGRKATQAIARLSTAQSEAAAEQALLELADILITAMNKSKSISPEKIGDAVIPSLPKRRYAKGRDLDGGSIKIEDEVIPFEEL